MVFNLINTSFNIQNVFHFLNYNMQRDKGPKLRQIIHSIDFHLQLLQQFDVCSIMFGSIPELQRQLQIENILEHNPQEVISVNIQKQLQFNSITIPDQHLFEIPLCIYKKYYQRPTSKSAIKKINQFFQKITTKQIRNIKLGNQEQWILYGVNFCPKKLKENTNQYWQIIKKTYPMLVPTHNLEDYIYGQFDGLNVPQVYYKNHKNYTTFHFQSGFSPAININFGPGSSNWIFINEQQLQNLNKHIKFESLVKKSYWITKTYLKQKNIQYLELQQKSGQAIIVSSMVGHMVFSNSKSVHISWNFFPRIERCLKHYSMFINYCNNRIIKKSFYPTKFLLANFLTQQASRIKNIVRVKLNHQFFEEILKEIEFLSSQKAKDIVKVRQIINKSNSSIPFSLFLCQRCNFEHIFIYLRVKIFKNKNIQCLCVNCAQQISIQRIQSIQIVQKIYDNKLLYYLREQRSERIGFQYLKQVKMENVQDQMFIKDNLQDDDIFSDQKHHSQRQQPSEIENNIIQLRQAIVKSVGLYKNICSKSNLSQARFINEFVINFLRNVIEITHDKRDKCLKTFIKSIYQQWLRQYLAKYRIIRSKNSESLLIRNIQTNFTLQKSTRSKFVKGIRFQISFELQQQLKRYKYLQLQQIATVRTRVKASNKI